MNTSKIDSSNYSVLLISRAYNYNSPVGIRFINFYKYLNKNYKLTTINLTNKIWIYSEKWLVRNILFKIYRRIPIFPDNDRLILYKYKRAIKKVVERADFDFIIVQVLPISFLLLGKYIKKVAPSAKLIFDLSDPVTINANFETFSSAKKKYQKKLEKEALDFIDHLIVLNEEVREYYSSFFETNNKISVIPQGYAMQQDRSLKKDLSFNPYNSSLKLIYAGTFYEKIREPFELYKSIIAIKQNVHLTIYGKFKKVFNPPVNDRFTFGGSISQKSLFDKYKESDVIIFIDNENSLQVPGKIFEILATNKSILCIGSDKNSPSLSFFKQFQGIFYARNNETEIMNSLNEIIQGKNYYWQRNLKKYHWQELLKSLNAVLIQSDTFLD